MTTPLGARIWYVVFALALILTACEKPPVTMMGEAVTVGGVEFKVKDYDIRMLELSEGSDTFEYPHPVMTIAVEMTNRGEGEFVYNPTHNTQQMSEAATPLLYLDPGAEAELPPASKTTISGVYLQKGKLAEQITQMTTVAPGQTITDVFLFEVPDPSVKNLILSLPPAMHRGELPVLTRIGYTPKEPKGPTIHNVGDAISRGDVTFQVDGAEITYVKMKDTAQGDGYSADPLLKIAYTIKNGGSEAVKYEPGHRELGGRRAASLFSKTDAYRRVRFAATATPEGQVAKETAVEPGKAVQDYVLFEVPEKGTEAVTFEYPASAFGASGLIRVQIPFEHKVPEKPKELKQASK